jgi:hypothetical protein
VIINKKCTLNKSDIIRFTVIVKSYDENLSDLQPVILKYYLQKC